MLAMLLLLLSAPPVRGVALGLYSEDPGYSYEPLLREIAGLGANTVELVINVYQHDGRSTELYPHTRFTATDESVTRTVAQARALGMRAVLFPIVRLESPAPGEWRGSLQPIDAAAWWRSYSRLLLRYATLARRAGAAGLCIGSELGTLDRAGQAGRWKQLAAAVRARFRGRLVYSANWDHFREVGLWDAVDVMGLSAYFELAPAGAGPAPDAALEARWRTLRAELEGFANARRKPLVFTEVGYLSQRGAAAWPWKEEAAEPVDLEEQLRCYRAFMRTWAGAPALEGVFFWNWYGWGGARSAGYTPRGKPAAEEISRWFRTP